MVVLLLYMYMRNEVTIAASGVICAQLSISMRTGTADDGSRDGGMTANCRTTRTSVHEALMTEATRVGFYADRLCGARYNASYHYNKNNLST